MGGGGGGFMTLFQQLTLAGGILKNIEKRVLKIALNQGGIQDGYRGANNLVFLHNIAYILNISK